MYFVKPYNQSWCCFNYDITFRQSPLQKAKIKCMPVAFCIQQYESNHNIYLQKKKVCHFKITMYLDINQTNFNYTQSKWPLPEPGIQALVILYVPLQPHTPWMPAMAPTVPCPLHLDPLCQFSTSIYTSFYTRQHD